MRFVHPRQKNGSSRLKKSLLPLASGRLRGLRENLSTRPLVFFVASVGLLAALGIKILFSRQHDAE